MSHITSLPTSIHRTNLFHTKGTMPLRRSLTTLSAPLPMHVASRVDNNYENPPPISLSCLAIAVVSRRIRTMIWCLDFHDKQTNLYVIK